MEHVGPLAQQAREWLRDERPAISRKYMINRVPDPQIGLLWSEKDENRLITEVTNLRLSIVREENITPAAQALWKVSLRMWKKLPVEFISRSNHLAYSAIEPADQDLSDDSGNLDWDDAFCEKLTHVLTHPIWQDQEWFLLAALQLAVIRRTDDRRRWPLRLNAAPDPHCSMLRSCIDQLAGSDIQDIFSHASQLATSQGAAPSRYFDFLASIAMGTPNDNAVTSEIAHPGDLRLHPYMVAASDLALICEAIDSSCVRGCNQYFDCKSTFELYWGSVGQVVNNPDLPSRTEISSLLWSLVISEYRTREMTRRRPASPDLTSPPIQRASRKRQKSSSDEDVPLRLLRNPLTRQVSQKRQRSSSGGDLPIRPLPSSQGRQRPLSDKDLAIGPLPTNRLVPMSDFVTGRNSEEREGPEMVMEATPKVAMEDSEQGIIPETVIASSSSSGLLPTRPHQR